MFHDRRHAHFLKIPQGFSKKSLFDKGMVCVAMGITNKRFMDLCDESLEKRELKTVASTIEFEVKANIRSLELMYGIRDVETLFQPIEKGYDDTIGRLGEGATQH